MTRFALALVYWAAQIDKVIFVMELPIKNRAERVVWDAKEVQSWTTSSSSGLEFIEWKSGIVTRRVWDRDTPRHRGTPWHLHWDTGWTGHWDTGVEDDSTSEEIYRVLIFSNGSPTINCLYQVISQAYCACLFLVPTTHPHGLGERLRSENGLCRNALVASASYVRVNESIVHLKDKQER